MGHVAPHDREGDVDSIEWPEPTQDQALEERAVLDWKPEGSMDPPRGSPHVFAPLLRVERSKKLYDGVGPEVPVDGALGGDESFEQVVEGGGDVGGCADRVALADERRKQAVARSESFAHQGDRDGVGEMLVVEISRDAEEVSPVHRRLQRGPIKTRREDGDGIHDGVEGIAGDGVAQVTLGVAETESFEGIVEERTDAWVEPRGTRLSCELLLVQPLA